MKQEQVIELAKKAGAEYFPGIGFDVISIDVARFASLVEQATMERAAQRFSDTPAMEFFGYEVASEIRHLAKDTQ